MLEIASVLIGASISIVPTLLWKKERSRKKLMELEYNIRTAQSLGHAAALRDHETGSHNYRVAYMSSLFGETLGLDTNTLKALMKGAFLHDVGKIGIPDRILLKNGILNENERKDMMEHPFLGTQLLEQMPWFKDAIPVVLHHHEKFDGSGYPDGLKGDAIPKIARIFAIIDVFDALIAVRPYKKAFSLDETLDILKKDQSTHFDPILLQKFILVAPEYFKNIINKSETELKEMLEARRKKIFGM